MKSIGIIGAMEEEVAILKEKMEDVRIIKKASMDFYEGTLAGRKAVVVRSGIGTAISSVGRFSNTYVIYWQGKCWNLRADSC